MMNFLQFLFLLIISARAQLPFVKDEVMVVTDISPEADTGMFLRELITTTTTSATASGGNSTYSCIFTNSYPSTDTFFAKWGYSNSQCQQNMQSQLIYTTGTIGYTQSIRFNYVFPPTYVSSNRNYFLCFQLYNSNNPTPISGIVGKGTFWHNSQMIAVIPASTSSPMTASLVSLTQTSSSQRFRYAGALFVNAAPTPGLNLDIYFNRGTKFLTGLYFTAGKNNLAYSDLLTITATGNVGFCPVGVAMGGAGCAFQSYSSIVLPPGR